MLVLARNVGESIRIDGPCTITVTQIKGDVVKVGITADRSVRVVRTELEGNADSGNLEPA